MERVAIVSTELVPRASKRYVTSLFLDSTQYVELKALSGRTGLTVQQLLRQGLTDLIGNYPRGRTRSQTALRTQIHHLLEE